MLSIAQRLFLLVRYLGITIAVAGTAYRLWGGTLMEMLPQRLGRSLMELWAIVATWPFYALGLILLGSWLQDHVDALLLPHEGRPSWIGDRLLRVRIGFTRRVIQRPFWYRNDDKIAREIGRANAALERGGFASLAGLIYDPEVPSDQAVEHLRAVEALIAGLGYRQAAVLSHRILDAPRIRECMLPDTASVPMPDDRDVSAVDGVGAEVATDPQPPRRRRFPTITIIIG